ncbi:serine--tRNA ligase [Paenibacillus sp. J31TS4]|uniref:serine--tRNA ligase n=1 Tax=Paenibacillus sp. J31TS4 TaxID=2807195 RepID=UPI001BCD5998|nr:serine--tRNA ligase [Paenibacillus sp. J31TS4]
MLAIAWIRDNRALLERTARDKGLGVSIIGDVLEADETRRRLIADAERLRKRRNELARETGEHKRRGETESAAALTEEAKELGVRLDEVAQEEARAARRFEELMLLVPNPVSADTPIGASDADNVEVRRVGVPRDFAFAPRDHVELGELHGMIDIPRAVRMAGARSYVLKGAGTRLHRAVQQLAMDLLEERGYTLLEVPILMREEAMTAAGFFPAGRDQTYAVEENTWLAGTGEVPLISYYRDEVLDLAEPARLAAATPCFRKEVGSAGRDTRGLYRVHQFAKVEQVVLCRRDPELADRLLAELVANAEQLLRLLELPYRVMAVCTGDQAAKTHKQFDLETWMPSRGAYGETHSASNVLDFQARRANLRYRDTDGRLQYAYTLNNTMVATPRILIPLLENHQQTDGSIAIPAALRPYLHGEKLLTPPQAEEEQEA